MTSPAPLSWSSLQRSAAAVVVAFCCSLLWVPTAAHAQGVSILANDALKALLGDQVDLPVVEQDDNSGSEAVMAGGGLANDGLLASNGLRNTYRVQRGETLDRIIRKTMRGTPLSIAILRKAFMALNPQAFPRRTPHVILANALLQIPTNDDLRAMAGGQPMTASGSATSSTDRRNWVRFP